MRLFLHFDGSQVNGPSLTLRLKDEELENKNIGQLKQHFIRSYADAHGTDILAADLTLCLSGTGRRLQDKRKLIEVLEDGDDIDIIKTGMSKRGDGSGYQLSSGSTQRPVAVPRMEVEKLRSLPALQQSLAEHLNAAENFYRAKQLRNACIVWNQLLQVQENCIDAWLGLADADYANGRWKEAIQKYARAAAIAIKGHPAAELIQAYTLGQRGKALHELRDYAEALTTFDSIAGILRAQTTFSESGIVRSIEPPTAAQVHLWSCKTLLAMEDPAYLELAINLLNGLLLRDENDADALLLYCKIWKRKDNFAAALQLALKVITLKPKSKDAKRQVADLLRQTGAIGALKEEVKPSPSSAPAYAFLATVVKDHGAVDACAELLKIALEQQPSNASYALNYMHALEILNRYDKALAEAHRFLKDNAGLSITLPRSRLGNYSIKARSVAGMLEEVLGATRVGYIPAKASVKLEWRGDKDGYAYATSIDGEVVSDAAAWRVEHAKVPQDEYDLLALYFTIVKILFLKGVLRPIPRLVSMLEPFRYMQDLHLTMIRNETAYYSCIAQLMAIHDPPFLSQEEDLKVDKPLYVCGDSHTLATSWRVLGVQGELRYLHPALVTGLKHWHLRPESDFYPKVNFFKSIETIPSGSEVIFIFGEIDCREGILMAVEKGKYESIEVGMATTIDIFLAALKDVMRSKKFKVYLHPVVPVLNETRHLVKEYNRIFKSKVSSLPDVRWLDFFPDLLSPDGTKLRKGLELDGTHLSPSYLRLLERAI